MPETTSRPRSRRSALDRVQAQLEHDFPGVAVSLSERAADLESGAARAWVLRADRLPRLPEAGLDHFAFPEDARDARGLALRFHEGDAPLRALRRFYVPPIVFGGAGPGGCGSMTVCATRALEGADLVLCDTLCGEEVLQSAAPDAEIVHVGKRCGNEASAKQAAINELILSNALRGRRVVRLKGGDPSVFGRLEEEIQVLSDRRLCYQVLPGIGAASGAAAFIGHPLTAREIASELILSTGRLAGGGKNPFPLDGTSAPAIALYMSRRVLASRMQDLEKAGYPVDTPVAVVERLGSPQARAVTGTVATIARIADEADVGTPAVVLVGAQYAEPTHLPLHGVRIWLPAEAETAGTQRVPLEALGAVCIQRPLIEPAALPVEEGALLSERFDWVLFTSKKSVDFLFQLLERWGYDARWMPRVAAIGAPAIQKLRARGIEPDLIPPEPTRASLCASLIWHGIRDDRILIPASAVAPDTVRETLTPHAKDVVRVDLYTLRFPRVEEAPDADVVLFSSESTVRSAKTNGLIDQLRTRGTLVGGIGPHCWSTIEKEGLELSIRPDGVDPAALARATRRFFARRELATLAEEA